MVKTFNLVQDSVNELPNNIEAEQSVIGSILVSNELFDDTRDALFRQHPWNCCIKRASLSNPKHADIIVLSEFVQVSYYAYEQRKILNLANQGVLKILEMGKKAVDVLAPSNRVYLKQQKDIHSALKKMKILTESS